MIGPRSIFAIIIGMYVFAGCNPVADDSTGDNNANESVEGNSNDNSGDTTAGNGGDVTNENASDTTDATTDTNDNASGTDGDRDASTWAARLLVSPSGSVTAGSLVLASSTQLLVAWEPPDVTVDHYELDFLDTASDFNHTAQVEADRTETTLGDLFSGTTYEVNLRACLDAACSDALTADETASAQTAEEYWQVVLADDAGEEDLSNAHLIVEDGNAKVFAIGFGDEAPGEVAGRVQLYYGATGIDNSGLSVAVSSNVITDAASAADFDSFAGTYGAVKPDTATALIDLLLTGQAVPLRDGMGDGVRLYFEGMGSDGAARIMYIDGQDGLLGRDFNASDDTLCNKSTHYGEGADCAVTVVFGVSGDTTAETPFANVRQFKIGYPYLDDWRWDGAAGAFMFLTIDQLSECGFGSSHNQVYATWDGDAWAIDFAEGQCPKAMQAAQAPSIVHLGDGRYKLYFGDKSEVGFVSGGLPFLGPKVVLYADATRSGDPDVVEFSDWDIREQARALNFIYPSGKMFTSEEEGYIDDFVMLTPSGDLDLQVMYGAWTDGEAFPVANMFVLVNP